MARCGARGGHQDGGWRGVISATRRGFLIGMLAASAAPVVVRASSLMPIKPLPIQKAAAIFQAVMPDGSMTIRMAGTDQFGKYVTEDIVITDLSVPRWSQTQFKLAMVSVLGKPGDGYHERFLGEFHGVHNVNGHGRVPLINGGVMTIAPSMRKIEQRIADGVVPFSTPVHGTGHPAWHGGWHEDGSSLDSFHDLKWLDT